MRNILIFTLLFIGLSSCSLTKMCDNCLVKCPPNKLKDSIRVDSVDRFVVRDSIIKTPGEKIFIVDSLPCPDFKAETHGKHGSAKVVVKDSIITVECEIDSQDVAISWIEHHTNKTIQSFHSEERIATIKAPKTGFQVFKDWWFWCSASLIALIIILVITYFVLKFTGKLPITIKRSG